MEEQIIRFITALRSTGVRVSLAESVDAFSAVAQLDIRDRDAFRIYLQATLVKDARDIPIFEQLFPLYFVNLEPAPLLNISNDLTSTEADMLAHALRQINEQIRHMLEGLMRGEGQTRDELNRLAKFVGLTQADNLRYREWIVQRMKKALRFRQVQDALQELTEQLTRMGMEEERLGQVRQVVLSNQQALEDQLRQFAGLSIAENISRKPPEHGMNGLLNRSFESLTEKDMELLRKEVQRLAASLRTRVALRQKRAKSGQLDAKATIRANLKHRNIPIQIKHRERSLKPKLVVICDISTSMRSCSELMLSLLYALQDQVRKTHAFAFIDHLEYLSPEFKGKENREAVNHVLKKMPSGYYNTDFGYSLENFSQEYMDMVDRRTTMIVVGDGRNNYNDPRVDLFRTIARRCRHTIWLTPEATSLWGTGDSDMFAYAPECDVVLKAGTLGELTAAVDKIFTQS